MRILLIFCILLFSCSKAPSPPEQKAARIHLSQDPNSLDPRKARDLDSVTLLRMLFEGMTRISQKGEVELALARDVQISNDGLRYVFSLKDTCWSNGDPVTAADFVKSWKTILNPSFPTDNAYHLYVIKNARKAKMGEVSLDSVGVSAKDSKTLVVELEHPTPYFLELLSMSHFFPVPSRVVEQNSEWDLSPDTYVSNGPFLLRAWEHADCISFTRNPKYWEAEAVSLNQIDFMIASPDTGLRMFEQGRLDWTGSPLSTVPADAIVALKGKLQISPFAATYFFRVNTSPEINGKFNPLANRNFRKALALSLDRKAIAEHVLQGGHTPAASLVPPEMGLSSEKVFSDWEEARKSLRDAEKELGQGSYSITLSYTNSERNAAIAQAVQKQWEEVLRITVALEAVEPKVYFQRVSKKEFQLAAGSWTADFGDPVNFLEVFKYKSGSTNNTEWENQEYIDLLDRSALCRDSEERKRLLSEAETVLMREMPVIPVFHFVLNYLKEDRLKGVSLSSLGRLDLRWAYWEENERL